MTYDEFNIIFVNQTQTLQYEKGLLLALDICKKLFSDYQKFTQEEQWGNANVLLDAMNLIQRSRNEKLNVIEIKDLIHEIENIVPDTEDFENCSYALNACTAVLDTLEYLIDRNSRHIFNIGTYLTDTIDFKIQENEKLDQISIDLHPLMIRTREYLIDKTK